MPPVDTWLEIIIRTPLLLLVLIVLVVIGLVASAAFLYRRLRSQVQQLLDRAQLMRAQLASRTEQEEEWAAARAAYEHFIYNVSHEVSNPLQSIQTNLDNISGCPADETEQARRYLDTIGLEVGRLRNLTESLRLLSRLETPSAATAREPVNLKGVIEEVIMTLFDQANLRDVRLRYVGPDRPPRVLGDRDQLRQVIINLVENGIKYSKPEGGEVIISLQADDAHVRTRVSDAGIGIVEEDLPHIFDTAYRAPDARSFRRRGTGLGLSIAQRIVQQHGSQIHVHSRLGEGSTFSFELPIHAPTE